MKTDIRTEATITFKIPNSWEKFGEDSLMKISSWIIFLGKFLPWRNSFITGSSTSMTGRCYLSREKGECLSTQYSVPRSSSGDMNECAAVWCHRSGRFEERFGFKSDIKMVSFFFFANSLEPIYLTSFHVICLWAECTK